MFYFINWVNVDNIVQFPKLYLSISSFFIYHVKLLIHLFVLLLVTNKCCNKNNTRLKSNIDLQSFSMIWSVPYEDFNIPDISLLSHYVYIHPIPRCCATSYYYTSRVAAIIPLSVVIGTIIEGFWSVTKTDSFRICPVILIYSFSTQM